ncbi:hypothetical protein ACMD2_25768 [Ananas comosus]|uniref:Aminotransferase-like plant mobile domain-containing protein n=1 Tax=Ananas comosus TaxID=4615 RepID=A0A199V148_ANACO|nr:hypothetical protein ACMD2_25768 [Ananas comosus]
MAEEEEEEEEELLVVEEREAEMAPSPAVAVAGDEPVTRKGFFLAPRQNPNGNPLVTPHSPKRYKGVSFSTLESPKILFKGWSSSLKQWDQWVNKLKPLHGDSWRKDHRGALGFNRSSYKKPDHSAWLKRFIERGGDELEHVAFLSLWLSRFVFCSHPEKTIRQHVLPIAVRIARGERIALAPAVLAGIYRDLREVKEYLASNERSKEFPLIFGFGSGSRV